MVDSSGGYDRQLVLNAYANGYFPMADSADDPELFWFSPPERGVLPLNGLHVPRRLISQLKAATYEVTTDQAFADVIEGCAASTEKRPQTWINKTIKDLFLDLHKEGYAHSLEIWYSGRLAGGIYGLALGSAFFGESMFHRERDASKLALVHLAVNLKRAGFSLFDCQFTNPFITRFGVVSIEKTDYLIALGKAIQQIAAFPKTEGLLDRQSLLQVFKDIS